MVYSEGTGDLTRAYDLLRSGSVVSLLLRPASGDVEIILLFVPHFQGDARPWWTLSADLDGPGTNLFWSATEIEGVLWAALAEDMIDIPDAVSEQSFPWDDWQLILGAVQSRSGLVVRQGRANE